MYAQTKTVLVSTAQMSLSCARPVVGLISYPTGRCIQELAAMMKAAESAPPTATAQMVARWSRLGSRFQPKIHRPRKTDSRKKAASPSMASGAPNTSPTKREYLDQFMPNWNSWTSPVTTPTAMLMTQQRAEEPGQPQVLRPSLAVPRGLQQGREEAQADRQRARRGSGRSRSWRTASAPGRHCSRALAPFRSDAAGDSRSTRPQKTAIGLTGEPVPPGIRSGATTHRNSHRCARSQTAASSSNCR